MNEFERRLKESLTEVRDAGRLGVEARRGVAKEELFRRIQRRRLWNLGGGALLAGAAAVAAFLLFTNMAGGPITEGADIDPADMAPPARALVEVGDQPTHVSVGALDYVWSSNTGSNDVSRIDPDTNEVTATVDVGSPPGDIAIGSGPVWVALPSEGQVVQINLNAGTIVGEPVLIATGGVEHMELSVGAGALWVVAREEGLWRVDLETGDSVEVGGVVSPTDVAVKGERLLVLSSDGLIYRLSSATGAEISPPLQVAASDDGKITLAGGSLWHFEVGGETISQLDGSSGEVVGEIDPPGTVVDFVIDPYVTWVLSARGETHYLTPVDRQAVALSGDPIEVQGSPFEAVIAGESLWLSLPDEDVILRFSKYR